MEQQLWSGQENIQQEQLGGHKMGTEAVKEGDILRCGRYQFGVVWNKMNRCYVGKQVGSEDVFTLNLLDCCDKVNKIDSNLDCPSDYFFHSQDFQDKQK